MNMTARTRQVDLVTVVDITGQLVRGEECTLFGKLVDQLLDKGRIRILMAYMMRALISARKRNGDLKLLNPRKELQAVLQITRMLSVIEISYDEATAVKSFAESANATSA